MNEAYFSNTSRIPEEEEGRVNTLHQLQPFQKAEKQPLQRHVPLP